MPIDLQTTPAVRGHVATQGSTLQAPGRARPHNPSPRRFARAPTGSCASGHTTRAPQHTAAHRSTPQHTTRAQRPHDGRPGSCTIDHGPADQLGRPAVHVENPAGRLDQLRAHKPRHDRPHEKQETSMHAREMCTRRRPTTAGGATPPLPWGFPPRGGVLRIPPLSGGYPH
jgi:hypothetical protein